MVVDAEDYSGVTGTYPTHPMANVNSLCKTSTELKELRYKNEKSDIKGKKDVMDKALEVASVKVKYKDYYQPQEFVTNPKYTATW